MYEKEIVKRIQSLSGKYSPYQIFADWLEMSAIAIQNHCVLDRGEVWQRREQRYLDIEKQYTKDEMQRFAEMLALLTEEFEQELKDRKLTDVLGKIYMELNYGNKHLGQVFTPYSLSMLCSVLTIDEDTNDVPFLEPCCGGGSMIIAVAQRLLDLNKDYQRIMHGICQDLDIKCVHMCYVQLSLLGIDAVIARGDSLTDPYPEIGNAKYTEDRLWRTPRNTGLIF